MRKILIITSILFITNINCQDILPLKERAAFINKLQKDRLNNLLPKLMEKTGIDMWVLIAREYNEDPIIKTMLPPTWLNARRTTIVVFSLDSKTKDFNSVAIARYAFGDNIPSIWNKEEQPNQWEALKDYIVSKNPEKIGINTSSYESLADGLSKYHYDQLYNILPSKYKKKVVSAEELAIAWIETRTELEMTVYSQLVEISSAIIREAFSTQVITPGITTTDDVVWWMREKVLSLGLDTWFHPSVDVQRQDNSDLYAFDGLSKFDIIQPGDLIHCDFGISYLTLNTDTQELGYILKPGEIITHLTLDEEINSWSGDYQKLSLRKSWDFPEAGVAVSWRYSNESPDEEIELRIATTALESIPRLHNEITDEALLKKHSINEIASKLRKDVKPVNNTAFPPNYRKKMVEVLCKKALHGLKGVLS